MVYKVVHLAEIYPFLKNGDADPTLEIMVQVQGLDIKRPAVIVCPGGGYVGRCPREAEPIALDFMADGANGFVLQYSVKPYIYPQQLLEAACAVDYIVKNAEEFHIDTEKIAILGFSAGGHLAASYCTMLNRPEISKYINPIPVNAAILCYPVITALGKTHIGSFKNLSGKEEITNDIAEFLSCERYVNELTPPTYIWATSNDNAVNVRNSLVYTNALAEHNIPVELHVFPKGAHGLASCKFGTAANHMDSDISYNSQWIDEAKAWLKRLFNY